MKVYIDHKSSSDLYAQIDIELWRAGRQTRTGCYIVSKTVGNYFKLKYPENIKEIKR